MSFSSAILTYHSQNISGRSTHDNDHVALAQDLEQLHQAGVRFIPLSLLIDQFDEQREHEDMDRTICLSFDDGCDFDVRDLDFPGIGVQRSFLGIMQDFIDRHGADAQPGLSATSFVIASANARRTIDAHSLFGRGWISDDWWRSAVAGGLLSIGNHGWDHNHPDLAPGEGQQGDFTSVNTMGQCVRQVVNAAEYIESQTGSWPELFAYPFGESSAFIREQFFPGEAARHGCRAALGTEPGMVTQNSDRWNLPRFVCGRDWQSPSQLLDLLA